MELNLISSLWLTVNRVCNLRCRWCYAEGSNYGSGDEMSLEIASNLFHLGYSLGARTVVILGGEPTLWKFLPGLIYEINKTDANITPIIVTNGILFSSSKFREKFQGLNYKVGLSLKASSREQYKDLTGSDSLMAVSEAIRCLTKKELLYGVSITINDRVVDNLIEMTRIVAENGGQNISFEMCAPSFDKLGSPSGEYLIDPRIIARKIVDTYPEIDRIMKGKAFFQMSIPFCLFPKGFIQGLMDNGKIISGCHVFNRDGVIFNPQGSVLLCNCLYHLPIGLYKKDFWDAKSFAEWWNKKEVIATNEKLLNYPSEKCVECKQYQYCGGGCCLQWFYFNPKEILQYEGGEKR